MAAFEAGDRVAWHDFAAQHAAGSIIKADAVPADAKIGTVKGVVNEPGTWFEVEFDDETRVLVDDELVKVSE